MQLITFTHGGPPALGALLSPERVLDLSAAALAAPPHGARPAAWLGSMLDLIRAGEPALAWARELLAAAPTVHCLPMSELRLLAPLPLPEQIRDFANYELHVRQALNASMQLRAQAAPDPEQALARLKHSGLFDIPPVWYERPLYFKCNRFSVVGHGAVVEWPAFAQKMDYELELAVVIGKRVRDVSEAEAMDAVFGYTLYNDFSARDVQAHESAFRMGPAKGKDFDTGNAFGPCIATRDAIPDPYALPLSVSVNGELKTQTTAAGMQHSIARCISFLSQSETLYPGEILAMGTVGNGCGYESLSFLKEGDEVTLEAPGIGRLSNQLRRN